MKQYPMIKFVILFIIGIVIQNYLIIPFFPLLIIVLLSIILLIFIKFFNLNFTTLIILILVISTGALYYSSRNIDTTEYPFAKTKLTKSIAYGTVEEISLKYDGKFNLIISTDSLLLKGQKSELNILLRCNIKDKDRSKLERKYDKLGVGQKVRIKGTINKARGERNPGEFDYYKYLTTKGISATLYAGSVGYIKIEDGTTNLIFNSIFLARKNISDQIEKIYNETAGSLLKGLILADRSEIDYRVKESFINSGVIHVLAVSGLHVGFIVLIFLFLFNRTNIYVRVILTITGLVLFLLVTNHPPSVFRATIMASVMLLTFLSNRNYNAVNSLSIAALTLLIIDPNELFNPGFQLSFSAVLSILLLYPLLGKWIKELDLKNNFAKYLLLFSAVSFAAQLGTLPFTLIYFHKLSVISLLANILVIPMIGVIVSLGILSLIVSTFWTWGALIFSSANMLITDFLFFLVSMLGELKISHFFIGNFSVVDSILYYLFFIGFLYALKHFSNRIALSLLFTLAVLNSFIYLHIDDEELLPRGKFSVLMIDIGQGDGILLKFPNEEYGLIDAGNSTPTFDNGERVIAPLMKQLGVEKIDHAFVSHMDSDHYKGFNYLVKNGLVAKIYKSKLDTNLSKDIEFEHLLNENKIEVEYYSRRSIDFGNARMYILNDTTNSEYNRFDTNNKSGVYKIIHGKNTFLFVGDAEKRAERLLTKTYGEFLQVAVLKAGHHGSKTSSSPEFISFVDPEIALISAGIGNNFNHPSPEVIRRFQKAQISIDRTDEEGAIIYNSDGINLIKIDWRDN